MGRILFWLILGAIVFIWIKSMQSGKRDKSSDASRSSARPGTAERMVRCDTCGVHMPESDSVERDGKIGCRDPQHCAHRVSA